MQMYKNLKNVAQDFLNIESTYVSEFDIQCDINSYLGIHKSEGGTEGWKLLLHKDEINVLIDTLAYQINKKFKGQPLVIAPILKGAVYFCVDLTIPYSLYFLEASSYKNSQTQEENVDFSNTIVPSKFQGKKVLLIDELFDNGKTLATVKDALIKYTDLCSNDITTCCLFQKEKQSKYPHPDLVGINYLPDVWYVGYGLDDEQTKRGFEHLFMKPREKNLQNEHDIVFYYNAHQNFRNTIREKISNMKQNLVCNQFIDKVHESSEA
jgi:hypoxanthine phosphoribosyltransferase